jgi:hypothetical protein
MSAPPADRGRDALATLRERSAGFEAALRTVGLPAWFLVIDLLWIAKPAVLGIDARLYQRAATAWLQGGDPWTVAEAGFPYAAGPHTLLVYAPTSVLPLEASVWVWLGIGLGASIWLVRRLGVPVWWVLFPPLVHAIWNGNPQTLMLALLIFGTPLAGGLAAIVKLYALLPLAFHPRRLVVALAILAVTVVLLPWGLYLDHNLGIGTHVATAWNGSAWRIPLLIPPTLVGLWVLRRRGGEWFSIPAVWPATQFYYVSAVLPAITGRPLLAAAFALPIPLLAPAVVIGLAAGPELARRVAQRRSRTALASPTSRPPEPTSASSAPRQ